MTTIVTETGLPGVVGKTHFLHKTPTTGTKVGIIYTTVRKHVRAHIYVDSDNEWPAIEASLKPGQSIAYVPIDTHHSGHDTFHKAIADLLGHATVDQQFTDPRCVIVDNASMTVEHVIMADDSVDMIPGKILVNHASADVGHRFDPVTRSFTAPT